MGTGSQLGAQANKSGPLFAVPVTPLGEARMGDGSVRVAGRTQQDDAGPLDPARGHRAATDRPLQGAFLLGGEDDGIALCRAIPEGGMQAITDRIKMTAWNAEEWLLELLVRHYPNPHDVRALLRSCAELAGEIRTSSAGVVITLDAPDIPLHRRALRGLCTDLNQLGATYPGTTLPVIYEVAVHHSEAVPRGPMS